LVYLAVAKLLAQSIHWNHLESPFWFWMKPEWRLIVSILCFENLCIDEAHTS
jgi:hypothetical protein